MNWSYFSIRMKASTKSHAAIIKTFMIWKEFIRCYGYLFRLHIFYGGKNNLSVC